MKLRLPHAPYISRKIALDLLNCGFANLNKGVDIVTRTIQNFIEEDIKKEISLDQRVEEIIEQNDDEIEFMQIDRKSMFWLVKKRLAGEFGFIINYEDRFSELSHKILDKLWQEDLLQYKVSENKMKNIIYTAIEDFIAGTGEIQEVVMDKISSYKRKIIPGTEEYEIVFEKLYEEELSKRGMM